MQYINPYELLGFEKSILLSELTSDLIKRSKKRLLIEIELNDNRHRYRGVEFTKADCDKAVNDLDDDEKRRFHYFIFQNKNLNDFLAEGSLSFFERHQLESIYYGDPPKKDRELRLKNKILIYHHE